LFGIQNIDQLTTHVQRGALCETWVISELLKARYNVGHEKYHVQNLLQIAS